MKEELKITMQLHVEVATTKYVKAHKRIVNGKMVKVRSHYRAIEG